MSRDYKAILNPVQYEACVHVSGPLLILAGAGSGKTRVITHRIAYLIENAGVDPSSILAVTFTNKAAREMKERVENLVGDGARRIFVSTFHSMGARLLRQHHREIGRSPNFVIYDKSDQEKLVKQVLKEREIAETAMSLQTAMLKLDSAKNNGYTPEDVHNGSRDYLFAGVYGDYEKKLQQADALDFGDLLMAFLGLLKQHQHIREYYQQRFRHVLVDEFQDTNTVQYSILKRMLNADRNLCVVGDDDQSIYRWRGAEVGNILNFEQDFPGARVIKLEQNYRSTGNILEAAGAVIARNSQRHGKKLWTSAGRGGPITVCVAANERAEADFIRDTIRELMRGENYQWSDFAIMYRANALSRVIEDSLSQARMPYVVAGGLRFYDRKEIKDVVAYLRLINTPNSSVDLERVINTPPRGIGAATIARLQAAARDRDCSPWAVLENPPDDLGAAARRKLGEFRGMMTGLMEQAKDQPLPEMVKLVLRQSGYLDMLTGEGTEEARGRMQNLDELVSFAAEFHQRPEDNSLQAFLEQSALVSDQDSVDLKGKSVTLMTIHTAKGLEFPVVFLTGWEEGVFPHSRARENGDELEEERRLGYVGITRAMRRLFITRAEERTVYGDRRPQRPSSFLLDLPRECVREVRAGRFGAGPYQQPWRRPDDETIQRPRYQLGGPVRSPAPPQPTVPARASPPARIATLVRDPEPAGASINPSDAIVHNEAVRAGRSWLEVYQSGDWQKLVPTRREEPAPAPPLESKVEYEPGVRPSRAERRDGGAWSPGSRVRHSKYGVGEIHERAGEGPEAKVKVYFPGEGIKTIIARFLTPV
ncbi:MAG: ATP-dependent DNA helicase PcrA [Myxococcota bacterium]|nr:ATP-dependent DNA helicase PcrA [Myxococcota bacterium]